MKIKNIGYVLNSFPNPSETFISDEIASMMDFGVSPNLFVLKFGDLKVVHSAAKKILDRTSITVLEKNSAKLKILISIAKLIFNKPRKSLFCLIQAWSSKDRWLYFQAAPSASDLLKKKNKYIHAHFADWNFRWAEAMSNWTGIPFGVTTHGYDLRNDPIPLFTASKLFAKADLIITISEFNKKLMVRKYGIPEEKIKIIHCGIDLERFSQSDTSDKLKDNKIKLLNIGRLVPEKGQNILIQALAEAKNRGLQFELTIIGSGPLRDDLIKLCKVLEVDDCIYFMGAQPQDIVIKMLQNSDVFVLSSLNEGLPIVCMEAMAMSVFMIATKINGVPELIEDKVTGLLVEPNNISDLVGAIFWVDRNRDKAKNMCALTRKKIELEFNRKKCTEALIKNAEKIVNS